MDFLGSQPIPCVVEQSFTDWHKAWLSHMGDKLGALRNAFNSVTGCELIYLIGVDTLNRV